MERRHTRINSRRKGKAGELELAARLREMGIDARRGVQYAGSPESPDVVALPGAHFEVKRVESLNIWNAVAQSERDAAADEVPVVCHRKNRTRWLITIPLDNLTIFCRRWLDAIDGENNAER